MEPQILPVDKAINADLYVYDTRKRNRLEKRVIRVRLDSNIDVQKWEGSYDSSDEEYHDNSRAGRSFGARETELYGVPMDHLVVVVGELLPFRVKLDQIAQAKWPCELPEAIKNAIPAKHHTRIRIVVCLLKDSLRRWYVLADKKDGLCSLRSLPRGYDREIFYYREWAKVDSDTHFFAKNPKKKWKSEIDEFCLTYIRENNADIPVHFHLSTTGGQFAQRQNRFECVVSNLNKSLACYKHSENPEYLNHMLLQLNQAMGCQTGDISQNHDMKLIVNLISGDEELSHEEADKAAAAYKSIWSAATPHDLPQAVTGGALYQLGTGLRTKVLREYPSLQENRYQQFISTFCTLYEKFQGNSYPYSESQRDIDIVTAYRSARRSAVSDVDLLMVPVKTGCPEAVVLVEIQQHIKELRFFIKLMSERIECISSAYPSRPTMPSEYGLPEHIRRLMNAIDVNEASEHVSHIIHYFTMQEKASLSSLMDMIAEVEASSIERMQTFARDFRVKVSLAEDGDEN
ncbi:unnamed protein product [Clonostachys chloroleuca]|uniref:Uncharacterized protein n=1 Tax=Clonostachys chloroleuca TaxID=1926264 RepID=A0AA35MAI3_9HYPO|nr:unnamed protein product [Clonostachys chloroleuca]